MDLIQSIVSVHPESGGPVGTGFVISADGLIATCAHVVEAAGGSRGGTVKVRFAGSDAIRSARVDQNWWRAPEADDVAILRLDGDLPDTARVMALTGSNETRNLSWTAYGFERGLDDGSYATGDIVGPVKIAGQAFLRLRSDIATEGFSGAPVHVGTLSAAVGMIGAIRDPDLHGRGGNATFAVPAETLQTVCAELKLEARSPYVGLRSYSEGDAEIFCGREEAITAIEHALGRSPRFVAILGPSGSGKSSLVHAGLIPRLRRRSQRQPQQIIVLAPAGQGNDPGRSLQQFRSEVDGWRTRSQGSRLVVALDPFEELFTNVPTDVRREFIRDLVLLLNSTEDVCILLAMRDDFYSTFVADASSLVPWLQRGIVNVPATLGSDDLSAIIERPASSTTASFEDGLVQAIVRDCISTAPALDGSPQLARATVLPLLEFALSELWSASGSRRRFTHEIYASIGGVVGSLSQWASRMYFSLGDEERRIARRVLTRLVSFGSDASGASVPDSRCRRTLGALIDDQPSVTEGALRNVVHKLASARLIVTADIGGSGSAELIHEVLLHEWSELREWVVEDRTFLSWLQDTERRAQAWFATGAEVSQRDDGELLRSRSLSTAVDFLARRPDEIPVRLREYVTHSAERDENEREHLIKAEHEKKVAYAYQTINAARTIGRDDADRAAFMAMDSYETYATSEAYEVIVDRLRKLPRLIKRSQRALRMPCPNSISDDERLVAFFADDGKITVTDCIEDRIVFSVTPEPAVFNERRRHSEPKVALSADGHVIAFAKGSDVRVYRIAKNIGPRLIATGFDDVAGLQLSGTGRHLFIVRSDATPDNIARERKTAIWDLVSDRMVYNGSGFVEAFSIDERYCLITAGSSSFASNLYDLGKQRLRIDLGNRSCFFTEDGRSVIAKGSRGFEVRSLSKPEKIEVEYKADCDVSVVFSPNQRYVAVVGGKATVFALPDLIEVGSAISVSQIGHEMYAKPPFALSEDGALLVDWYTAPRVRVRRITDGEDIARLPVRELEDFLWSADGRYGITTAKGLLVQVWSVDSGDEVFRLPVVPFGLASGTHLSLRPVVDGVIAVTEFYEYEDSSSPTAVRRSVECWEFDRMRQPIVQELANTNFTKLLLSDRGTVAVVERPSSIGSTKIAILSEDKVQLAPLAESSSTLLGLSRDGLWVVYYSFTDGAAIVNVVNRQTSSTMTTVSPGIPTVCAFSDDSTWLVIAHGAKEPDLQSHIIVYDLNTQLEPRLTIVDGSMKKARSHALDPEYRRRIIESEIYAMHQNLTAPWRQPYRCVAIAPDSTTIVAACEDGRLRSWERSSGELVAELDPVDHTNVQAFWFLSSTAEIVALSDDGKLMRCDSTSLSVLDSRNLHPNVGLNPRMSAIAVSPSEQYVATAMLGDDAIRLWATPDFHDAGVVKHQIDDAGTVTCSPDGRVFGFGRNAPNTLYGEPLYERAAVVHFIWPEEAIDQLQGIVGPSLSMREES